MVLGGVRYAPDGLRHGEAPVLLELRRFSALQPLLLAAFQIVHVPELLRVDVPHGHSSVRASVIAARKSICVSGSFRGLPPTKGRETGRRKAHLGNGRGLFPGLPANRGTRQRLSASRRGDFFGPGTGSSERRRG